MSNAVDEELAVRFYDDTAKRTRTSGCRTILCLQQEEVLWCYDSSHYSIYLQAKLREEVIIELRNRYIRICLDKGSARIARRVDREAIEKRDSGIRSNTLRYQPFLGKVIRSRVDRTSEVRAYCGVQV